MAKFKHPAFPMSTDYDLLWTLVMSNNMLVPAWVNNIELERILHHHTGVDSPYTCWDLVEVKKVRNRYYSIGTRGESYEGKQTKQGFIEVCESCSLHFILPQNV
jgi:hypothetical protein